MRNLIERRFEAPVSIEVAWEHFAQVEQWPSWASHIKHLELKTSEPLGEHATGVIYLQNGIKTTFSMTEFNFHQNWKWVGPFLWLTFHYDHRFHALDDNRCEMTFHVAASGFAVSIIGPLFALIYKRNLDVAIPNLIRELQAN